MASPMYSTGIGLVIVGIERYQREKDKLMTVLVEEEVPVMEVKVKKQKKEKVRKDPDIASKKFTETFMEKIRNWFEEENE
jgi:cell division ATPase FtsA